MCGPFGSHCHRERTYALPRPLTGSMGGWLAPSLAWVTSVSAALARFIQSCNCGPDLGGVGEWLSSSGPARARRGNKYPSNWGAIGREKGIAYEQRSWRQAAGHSSVRFIRLRDG